MIIATVDVLPLHTVVVRNLCRGVVVEAANQPFYVLREATYEEYRAEAESEGYSTATWRHRPDVHYYELTTD